MTKKTFQKNNSANSQLNQANSGENLLNPIQIYNEWLKNHKKKMLRLRVTMQRSR